MIILGLTGSIGMGKSTASAMLRRMGVPVYDSDASVHKVLGKAGEAVGLLDDAFPGVVKKGAVDRNTLGERVFNDDAALKLLESIVHPIVRKIQDNFLKRCGRRREPLVVLDVPLLFEVNLDKRCDASVVISAPAFVQAARVLSRSNMTEEKFNGILLRQMPDAAKRQRADFVVPSGRGRAETLRHLQRIVRLMKQVQATHWPPDTYADRTTYKRENGGATNARARTRY